MTTGACVDVDFNQVASQSHGAAVQIKICESCGRNFLREGAERDCARCVALLRAPKKSAPIPKSPRDFGRVRRIGTEPQMGARLAIAWRMWERERARAMKDAPLIPATKAKGPRFVLTAEERARRNREKSRRYVEGRRREKMAAQATSIQ